MDILLKQNNNISYEIITDYWKDTGTPEDIIHANGEIIKKMNDINNEGRTNNSKIIGKVIVGNGSIIEPNVTITGPVIIGKNCKINSGTIIGPNTSIGNNTELSKCQIKNSIVMEKCKINSEVIIKDSIIANNSEITKLNNSNNEKIFLLGEGSKIAFWEKIWVW